MVNNHGDRMSPIPGVVASPITGSLEDLELSTFQRDRKTGEFLGPPNGGLGGGFEYMFYVHPYLGRGMFN